MQRVIGFIFFFLFANNLFAKEKEIVTNYPISDSVRPSGVLIQLTVQQINSKKQLFAGIEADGIRLAMETKRKSKEIVFNFPKTATVLAKGIGVDANEKGELEWRYQWNVGEPYQLYIATNSDSAENFTLYSGYVYLAKQNKWKLIGTCKVEGKWGVIKETKSFISKSKKDAWQVNTEQVWLQRMNGRWKNLQTIEQSPPILGALSSIDSSSQADAESKFINESMQSGKLEKLLAKENVYYNFIKEGSGNKVLVTDTVTVFYKGYLLENGNVFDQTKEKPATFPLGRLIKGWQIALTECKVGGKVKIIIPSGLAYGIRPRGAKIPPNSILVFEIEVTAAKPK